MPGFIIRHPMQKTARAARGSHGRTAILHTSANRNSRATGCAQFARPWHGFATRGLPVPRELGPSRPNKQERSDLDWSNASLQKKIAPLLLLWMEYQPT